MTNLSHKDTHLTEEEILRQEAGMSERERLVMKKLKEVVDKQRDEIRAKDRELTLKNDDVEALQLQQNRLMRINHELRHKVTVMDAQGKGLIEQKVELETRLQTREQEMGKLRQRAQGQHLENGGPQEPMEGETVGEEEVPPGEGSPVDGSEANRPRFTLQELRDVLHERNELKAKVFLLQEEMAYYRSEEQEDSTGCMDPPPHPPVQSRAATQPDSGIRRLIFTAIMPMVAAGVIADDPTLQPIRRLVSLV